MANRWRNNWKGETLFWEAPKSLQMVTATMKFRYLLLGRKAMTNLDIILKSRALLCQQRSIPSKLWLKTTDKKLLVFPVVKYGCELDYKENWALKNWCFWTVVLEKTLESPLDCKEIQPVNFKGNKSWIFIGKTDTEAETTIIWPPDVKNWPIGKDPDASKDRRWEGKEMTENEMVGWHHWFNGPEF